MKNNLYDIFAERWIRTGGTKILTRLNAKRWYPNWILLEDYKGEENLSNHD